MTEKSLNVELVGVVDADAVNVKSPVTPVLCTEMFEFATADPPSAGADNT